MFSISKSAAKDLPLLKFGRAQHGEKNCWHQSREWKYEEEYRLIIPREKFKDIEGEKEGDPLFWSIKGDEQVVRSVIIGSRCDPQSKDELAAVLAEPAYQHVETFEAVPDKRSFAIHIKPVTLR
jgi:hypothetical protein